MNAKIILASQSPFRKAQLEALGLPFQSQDPQVDERGLEDKWTGDILDLPVYLSQKKAEVVAASAPEAVVIGSDQMLIFNGQSFAKPETIIDCRLRLKQLQGQTHELHTGMCVIRRGEIKTAKAIARLEMIPLTDAQIEKYVDLDQPLGCAGGYKIEQRGLALFSKVDTPDHSSIVGLPLLSLVSILREWEISIL